tara:strand:- start:245 stop:631 length:387 start_codon:yes stop_codon:yes gene_type:complete
MKAIILLSLLVSTLLSTAMAFEDGTYVGVNAKTGGKCTIKISFDGDYLTSNRADYRLTVASKGPRVDCKDDQGVEFYGCAYGNQSNGNEERSLYMLLARNGDIEAIYFYDSDFDSTNDRVCTDFIKQN